MMRQTRMKPCLCILMLVLMTLELHASPMNEITLAPGNMTDEERLLDQLFKKRHYNPMARPAAKANDTVTVQMSFIPLQIVDVDELNEILHTHAWIELSWLDFRLAWNPDDFGGLKKIVLPHSSVWTPHIALLNSAEKWKKWPKVHILVTSDGKCKWVPTLITNTYCSINITWFPFDEQKCYISFEPWDYDVNMLNLTLRYTEINMKYFEINSEWNLTELTSEWRLNSYNTNISYSNINFTLRFRRQPMYYTFNLMMPCTVLSVISVTPFILPIKSGERIGLGISTLLALAVNQLIVAEKVPTTSNAIPIIGVYNAFVSMINMVSLIAMTVISNMYYRKSADHTMPNWMKVFICDRLGKLIRLKRPKRKKANDICNCCDGHENKERLLSTENDKPTKDSHNEVEDVGNNDWQYAALVIDRLCFFISAFYVVALALIVYGCAVAVLHRPN